MPITTIDLLTTFEDDNAVTDFVDDNAVTDFVAELVAGVFGEIVLSDRVLDFGLAVLTDECNRLVLCSLEPTTFAQANVTYMVGHKTVTLPGAHIFSAAADDPSGRRVSLNQIFDGVVDTPGTPSHWAALDTANERLLIYGPVVLPKEITTTFAMAPFDVVFLTQAATA